MSPTDAKAASSLGHLPGDKWEFDDSVTDVFPDMLERSIPDYRAMRQLVTDLGSEFVKDATTIVDLGCSRGDALAPFIERYGARNQYIGIEVSQPMIETARNRFSAYPESIVRIMEHDLRQPLPYFVPSSLILGVLTIMFTPINYRQRIVQDCYDRLTPGGAFILVEKLLGGNAVTDGLMVKHYHAMKAANGYTQEEIDRKRMALEGVQVPVTASWNEELLRTAGFRVIECFWRRLNFAGWIAVK